MKKTISLLISSILLLGIFSGCSGNSIKYGISTEPEVLNSKFSSPFYSEDIKRNDSLTDDEVYTILSKVPFDQYEAYPDQHNVPISATLYKDNEEILIDIRDRRLIRLINFYNNAVYHWRYAYSQGCLKPEDIEATESESYRLVLKYTPVDFEDTDDAHGDTYGTLYDTIIVTNEVFVPICHDIPCYTGPSTAFYYLPLYREYPWLDLFGFSEPSHP